MKDKKLKDNKLIQEARKRLEDSGIEVIDSEFQEPEYLEIGLEPFILERMEDFRYRETPKKDRGRVVEPVRSTPKIENNELCPCGSEKKYKKCCKFK